MPRKKKTETVPAAEVKTETAVETVNETAAEVTAPAEKSVKKTVAKKTPAVKKTTKAKAETATKSVKEKVGVKPAAKEKTTTAKSAAKSAKTTSPKEVVKLQFGSDEFDIAEIKKAVEADYKGKFKGRVETIDIYIKPEDKAVYYVINSDFSDKIEL